MILTRNNKMATFRWFSSTGGILDLDNVSIKSALASLQVAVWGKQGWQFMRVKVVSGG